MPKAPKKPRSQLQLVLCRCKSKCLQYNSSTGTYNGRGEKVSPGTRARHRRDDRLLSLLQSTFDNGSEPEVIPVPDRNSNEADWLQFVRTLLPLLRQFPPLAVDQRLIFTNDPATSGPYISDIAELEATGVHARVLPLPNMGPSSLQASKAVNQPLIEAENRLWELHRTLQTFEQDDATVDLQQEIFDALLDIDRDKQMQWEACRGASATRPYFNTDVFFRSRKTLSRAADTACILSIVLQYHYFLPRRGCELYLAGVTDVMQHHRPLAPPGPMPVDPQPLASRFHLDPITTTFICCPNCHSLYPFKHQHNDRGLVQCIMKRTPSSEACGAELWKAVDRGPRGVLFKPVRKYVHQGMKPWLGRLLSRPGIENILETYPRDLLRNDTDGKQMDDIWQGQVFREIQDPNGEAFLPGPPGELRLAFSLSIDSFSTFQNKTAKQSCSSTGIWMVLLNLPWHLRYLPQNIYLAGVIPGPQKPSNDEINHYVRLLVDDLQELWNPGVFFSRTFEKPGGRVCKGVLIPVVCDLLAAHQVIGYPGAPTAHYFCTCCDLDIDDINIIDQTEWPQKNLQHIRRYANIYRGAQSERDQQAIFEACGWRWSPLFLLEYWNPPLFTVIDSMHSLDLNLMRNHVRNLLQIDFKHKRGNALRAESTTRVKRVVDHPDDIRTLRACQEVIFQNNPHLLYELLKFQRRILYSFCLDYDIRMEGHQLVVGTRWLLAKSITEWRQLPHAAASFLQRYPRLSHAQEELLGDQTEEGHEGEASDTDSGDDGASEAGSSHGPSNVKPAMLRRLSKSIVALLDEEDEIVSGRVYAQVSAQILAHFCDVLSLNRTTIDLSTRRAKKSLFNLLMNELKENPDAPGHLLLQFAIDSPVADADAFLGSDVMEAVYIDMRRTRLPSWITPAPHDWGTSRRGKLSADNWRIICCIHLPITLIRLFGTSEGRPQSLLGNFMDLVAAVRLAAMRQTSPEQIQMYNKKIIKYTEGTLELFPDYNILPSHHAAIHIGDMLTRFGPKHAHDSPHYERYINFFHHMNTNNHVGEVEGTFMRTAARNANILALLGDSPQAQGLVQRMVDRMKRHEKENLRGFRLAEALDPFNPAKAATEDACVSDGVMGELLPQELDLLTEILQAVVDERNTPVDPNVTFLSSISYQHDVYGTWNSPRYRDSAILYSHDGDERAGIIQKIFLHRHKTSRGEDTTSRYVLTAEYRTVARNEDRFRKYGSAGGFSCIPAPQIVRLIRLESVICHIAVTDITEQTIVHILPINRRLFSFENVQDD